MDEVTAEASASGWWIDGEFEFDADVSVTVMDGDFPFCEIQPFDDEGWSAAEIRRARLVCLAPQLERELRELVDSLPVDDDRARRARAVLAAISEGAVLSGAGGARR